MTAIVVGQRELIIGDRQTGRRRSRSTRSSPSREHWGTDRQVKCIYVAIGQKDSTVREVQTALAENGALEYTVIVDAPASSPASFRYIAPYAGSALGQYWMYKGESSLIIFDDLSKQAMRTERSPCLLRRPPAARRTRATCSTCTRACSSAARSSPTSWARVADGAADRRDEGQRRLGLYPHERISITTGRSTWSRNLFYSGVRRRSTSASRSPGWAGTRRSRP